MNDFIFFNYSQNLLIKFLVSFFKAQDSAPQTGESADKRRWRRSTRMAGRVVLLLLEESTMGVGGGGLNVAEQIPLVLWRMSRAWVQRC